MDSAPLPAIEPGTTFDFFLLSVFIADSFNVPPIIKTYQVCVLAQLLDGTHGVGGFGLAGFAVFDCVFGGVRMLNRQ